MTVSSFEGWEDVEATLDKMDGVEATHRPFGTMVDERPVVDTAPIDEFGTDVEAGPPEIEAETWRRRAELAHLKRSRQVLKEERSDLKVQMINIESYPELDTYENGTVLVVHMYDDDWYGDMHQAILKERDKWYVAGQFHPYTWDELVAKVMREFHVSEVEVIHPPERKKSKKEKK